MSSRVAPTLEPQLGSASLGGEIVVGPPHRYRPMLHPGWPLNAIFVAFPLWWILGISVYVCFAMAGVMAFELVRRRVVPLPRGFGWWLLFLLWVAGSVLVLQVDAPGAVPGSSAGRYLIWAYRLGWYLSATVVLLYVCTMWREVSTRRIARAFSWMFVWIVAGGLLGTFAPHLNFPSLLELLLPHRLTSIGFIYYQVHPAVAQVGDVLGYEAGRPSAPFSFANDWGLNFLCFLPFFVVAWLGPEAGWRRRFAPLILLASVVPVVYSLNRGLWLTIVVLAFFIAIRAMLMGRARLLLSLVAAALVTTLLVLTTPLGSLVTDRFSSEDNSNEGRSNLVLLAVNSMADGSPVLGFGSTRDVQGAFTSIAQGDTAQCPYCSPPPLGTQGRLWLVAFSEGFGGVLWYLGFFLIQFIGYRKLRSAESTAWLTVLLASLATLPVYDALGPAMFAIMTSIGLLWREQQSAHPVADLAADQEAENLADDRQPLTSAARRSRTVRAVLLVSGCAIVGGVIGAGWQAVEGTPSSAQAVLLMPAEPTYPQGSVRPTTLDTVARIAAGPRVLESMKQATGLPELQLKRGLQVSALPNTRILVLNVVADDPAKARIGVEAASQTLLRLWDEQLVARRHRTVSGLRTSYADLSSSLTVINKTIASISERDSQPPVLLQNARDDLRTRAADVNAQIADVISLPLDPGEQLRSVSVRKVHDGWTVKIASGVVLGLMVGIFLARRKRRPAKTPLRRPRARPREAPPRIPVGV